MGAVGLTPGLENPHACGAAGWCTPTIEPALRACAPETREATAIQKPTPQLRSSLRSSQLEKASAAVKTQHKKYIGK